MSAADPLEFLGEEFLTWLWFRIETQGGDFDLPGNRAVGLSFDDFLAFAPRDDDETEHTLKKGTPSRSAEASTALRSAGTSASTMCRRSSRKCAVMPCAPAASAAMAASTGDGSPRF